jgi:hypothetical protein
MHTIHIVTREISGLVQAPCLGWHGDVSFLDDQEGKCSVEPGREIQSTR